MATLGVLHTTESDPGSFRGVANFFDRNPGSVPHVLYDPSTGEVLQFLAADEPAKALRNLPGGVETNRRDGGVFQVEIVGRASECGGYDDEWYSRLQAFLVQWSTLLRIPYSFYDGPRLTPAQWSAVEPQWYGHAHVPENDHSDPGTLDLARLRIPLQPEQEAVVAALEDVTPITIYPGGDRTKASQKTPLTSAIAYAVDASAQAEANTLQILAAIKLLQPVAPSIRTFTTAELLAELVRRQSA